MKLSIGIVGLPNVGKSTLFKFLTKQEVNIANYPFCTIDPNVGVVAVPDERLAVLAKMNKSEKIVPAVVEFYDIAGLVKGAYKGEGLGNKFLAHIRETSVVLMVLRCFSGDVVHVENSVDPERDMEIINSELALKDLETIDKRLRSLEKEMKSGSKEAAGEQKVLLEAKEKLGRGELLIEFADEEAIKNLGLLAAKKQIYLLNGKDNDVGESLKEKIKKAGASFIVADLSSEAEAEKSLAGLIKEAYQTLSLISFFTSGEIETKAWTVVAGAKAPQAAGVIHTDFEKKFIRAEVAGFADLNQTGSWQSAKAKGLVRLEGKDYEIKDGDVVFFRHG